MYENAGMEEDIYEVADSDQVVSNSQVEIELSASPAEELGDEEEVYDVVGDPRRSSTYKYTNPPTSTSGLTLLVTWTWKIYLYSCKNDKKENLCI